jgi:hypothetical protein
MQNPQTSFIVGLGTKNFFSADKPEVRPFGGNFSDVPVNGEVSHQDGGIRAWDSVPNLVARGEFLSDSDIKAKDWPGKVPTYDDGGNHGSSAAHDNYTVSTFVRLSKAAFPLENLENKVDSAFVVRSSTNTMLHEGAVVFGFQSPGSGVGSCSGPSYDVRMTVRDLNTAMYDAFATGSKLNLCYKLPAFSDPELFTESFFFAGSVLLSDKQIAQDTGRGLVSDVSDDPSGIPVEATDSRYGTTVDQWTSVVDHVRKGFTSILNLWGNSPITITAGVKLYLVLRWVPVPTAVVNGEVCVATTEPLLMEYMDALDFVAPPGSEDTIRWVLQLVPVATKDDRKPFWAEESGNGRGHLFFVGTVLRNPNNSRTCIPPQLRNMYRRLTVPGSGRFASTEEMEMCGFLEVAIGAGIQYNF